MCYIFIALSNLFLRNMIIFLCEIPDFSDHILDDFLYFFVTVTDTVVRIS